MSQKGIDCASKLTATSAKALVKEGITHVGRYLSAAGKGLTKTEVTAITNAGLKIFSIYETNPIKLSYFTVEQGKVDAAAAEKLAKALGQPEGSVIYFTVDYDAQKNDFDEILAYFKAVVAGSKCYKVGAYGSYSVLDYLHSKKVVDYYFQTYAWSKGKENDFAHIYQYKNDTKLAGVAVDLDEIKKNEVGAWGEKANAASEKPAVVKPPATSDPKKTSTYKIKNGDTLWGLEEKNGWEHGTLQKLNPNVDPKKLKEGQAITTPAAVKNSNDSDPKYYTVEKGDNLTKIATKYHTTIQRIVIMNKLKDKNIIIPGQKLRVK